MTTAEEAALLRLAHAVLTERVEVNEALRSGVSPATIDASAAVDSAIENWQRIRGEVA